MKDTWFATMEKWLLAIIIIFAGLLYGQSLENGYSIDDYLVSENLEMVNKGISGIPEILTSYYGKTDLGNPFEYRPISRITFAVERSLFGEKLWISHLINVLLYAFLCFEIFRFLKLLLGEKHTRVLLIGIVLFLFHPVHSEVVCSLKNRDEILSLLFALWSARYLIRFTDNPKPLSLLISSCLFLLSLATKPGQLPLAGVIVLGLFLFRKAPLKTLIVAGAPYFILTFSYLATILHFFPQWWRLDYAYEENSLYFLPGLIDRLPTAFAALYHNIRLLVWPKDLSFFYGYDHISVAAWNEPMVWISGLLLMTLIISFFALIKKHPLISFGIGVFIMSISPFLNVIGAVAGIVAERWLLSASIGFCLILAYGILKLLESKLKTIGIISLVVILGLYGYRTTSRIPDWKSSRTLVYKDVQTVPRSFVPNFLAANFYREDAENALTEQQARKYLLLSLKSNEMLADICIHKTRYLRRCIDQSLALNKSEKTLKYARLLFEDDKQNVSGAIFSMKALLTTNQPELGLSIAKETVSLHANNFETNVYLANFQLMQKDTSKALLSFRKALTLNTNDKGLEKYITQLENNYSH
jgi:hypothetical protein